MTNLSLYTTTAVLVLDTDGNRLLAKYYAPTHRTGGDVIGATPGQKLESVKEQRAFEKGLWEKTKKGGAGDIILYSDLLVLYKPALDLIFYVVGPASENELMLSSVLNAFHDAVSMLLRHQVEKRSMLENLDLVLLALDETVDDGIILETDPTAIASRVSRPKADTSDIVINEQTIMRAFDIVKDRVAQRIGAI